MSLGCERHRRGEFDCGDRFTDSRGGRYGFPDSAEPDGVRRRRKGYRYSYSYGGIAVDHGRRAGACRLRRGGR